MSWYRGQIVHQGDTAARPPRFQALDPILPAALQGALSDLGVQGLYAHQAEAIDDLRRGENVIVATSAASGKSLCYNLPVLESILEDRTNCALYLFPTKALAQDQVRSLAQLTRSIDPDRVHQPGHAPPGYAAQPPKLVPVFSKPYVRGG